MLIEDFTNLYSIDKKGCEIIENSVFFRHFEKYQFQEELSNIFFCFVDGRKSLFENSTFRRK